MLALSLLLMASAGAEIYRWANPPVAPAAPRAQEAATEPPTASPNDATTTPEPSATPAPEPSATPEPTAAPSAAPEVPTATPEPAEAATAAPAPTEPPTATPTATAGPLETVVVDPPLTISQVATVSSSRPGGQFSYLLDVISTSHQPRNIRVQMQLDSQLELLEANPSVGSCQLANPVICSVSAQMGQPAHIQVDVRVRSDATLGSGLAARTVAEDDERVTATADPAGVYLEIVASAYQASNSSALGSATPAPAFVVESPTPAATERPEAGAGVSRAVSTATPTATASPAPSAAATAPAAAGAAAPSSALADATPPMPPTLGPSAPSGGGDPIDPTVASPVLPNTSAALPILGIGLGVLGLALTVHSARRIRRANGALTESGAAIGQLSPLIEDAVGQQHATVDEIRRMQKDSDEMLAMLRGKRA